MNWTHTKRVLQRNNVEVAGGESEWIKRVINGEVGKGSVFSLFSLPLKRFGGETIYTGISTAYV